MDKKLFQAQATIGKITTLSDNTIRLNVDCQESGKPEEESMLFALRNKLGWFLFSEQELKADDVKDLPDITVDRDEKHPSTRLRACLYVLWQQTKKTETFEEFYRIKMEKIITFVKEKLN